MSFPLETPIGLLPYAISPNGEVNFLFWKASATTPQHSSTLFGHCIGVKSRFDQSMWDVCARTWAECSGGLFAISEEFRAKREKKEKKLLKELKSTESKDSKKDKKSAKKDESAVATEKASSSSSSSSPSSSSSSASSKQSILTYKSQQTEFNPKEPLSNEFRFFSSESKTFQNFELLYKMQTHAHLVYNSTKSIRKMLTNRKSGTVTLTNDNPLKPEFLYCVQIEYMPLWMVNYLAQDNGNGSCMWVSAHDFIQYVSLQLLSNIPAATLQSITQSNPSKAIQSEQSTLISQLHKFTQTQKSDNTSQIITVQQSDAILADPSSWNALVGANKDAQADVKDVIRKIAINSPTQCTDEIQSILLQNYQSHQIPINLSLFSVLTIESMIKLVNLCNTAASNAQSSPLVEDASKIPQQYQLPAALMKYYQNSIDAREEEDGENAGKPKQVFTPSQRQQFALDLAQSTGYYKCRQCRNILFSTTHLTAHDKFDLEQHFEKAQAKHFQQQNSQLQGVKKAARMIKFAVLQCDKELRKYLTQRSHQSEVAMYDDDNGDNDDDNDDDGFDDDDDYYNDEDEDDDGDFFDDDEGEMGPDMFDLEQFQGLSGGKRHVQIDDEDDDGVDYTRLIVEPKFIDIQLLFAFKDCVTWTEAQSNDDDDNRNDSDNNNNNDDDDDESEFDPREATLRHQFLVKFHEYQEALQTYLTERARLDEHQAAIAAANAAANGLAMEQPDDDKVVDANPTRGNFSETKGNGVFVKPVFGKASAKGFTGAIEGVCQSVFLDGSGTDLPPTLLPMDLGAGDIVCANCNYRCGNYSWSGTQCSCGKWVVPGLQVPLSKVDFSALDKKKFNLNVETAALAPSQSTQPIAAALAPQPAPGVIPAPFGSTTNLPTGVPTTIVGARRLQAVRPPVKKPTPQ